MRLDAAGMSAAIVSPTALALLTTTFSQGEERTGALGLGTEVYADGQSVPI